jgi:hypothetical protein
MPMLPSSTSLTIPALAKTQLEAMKKAQQDLAQQMQSFINGCAIGMGIDLATEKWEFDSVDTFRHVPDAPAAPASPAP